METSRVALVALACVVFFRISAAEVEMRVRAGDNVTLYCDCVWKSGFELVWFRNCSEKDHPPFMIKMNALMQSVFPRYSVVFNASTNTHKLLIKSVSESDEGLYYCALSEKKITDKKNGVIHYSIVYHYGNRSTRLSILTEPCISVCDRCVSEASVNWTLMLSVCSACVLVSSLVSSICVYCLCRNTAKAKDKASPAGRDKSTSRRHEQVGEDEVCYASLDIQELEKRKRKKKRVQQSDFSTYSEVRTKIFSGGDEL